VVAGESSEAGNPGFARDDKGRGNSSIKSRCRSEAPLKSNLDKFEVQPSPFDKLRAGSSALVRARPAPNPCQETILSRKSRFLLGMWGPTKVGP
jgi:hypothetical protein